MATCRFPDCNNEANERRDYCEVHTESSRVITKLEYDQRRVSYTSESQRQSTRTMRDNTSDSYDFYAFLSGLIATIITLVMYVSAWILIKVADPLKGPDDMSAWVATPINLLLVFTAIFLMVFVPLVIGKLMRGSERVEY